MESKTVLLDHIEGSARIADWPTAGDAQSAALKGWISGWFETISFEIDGNRVTLWIDEEGKLKGLPVNWPATLLVQDAIEWFDDVIVGPAMLTGGEDNEGDTLGLSDKQAKAIIQRVKDK